MSADATIHAETVVVEAPTGNRFFRWLGQVGHSIANGFRWLGRGISRGWNWLTVNTVITAKTGWSWLRQGGASAWSGMKWLGRGIADSGVWVGTTVARGARFLGHGALTIVRATPAFLARTLGWTLRILSMLIRGPLELAVLIAIGGWIVFMSLAWVMAWARDSYDHGIHRRFRDMARGYEAPSATSGYSPGMGIVGTVARVSEEAYGHAEDESLQRRSDEQQANAIRVADEAKAIAEAEEEARLADEARIAEEAAAKAAEEAEALREQAKAKDAEAAKATAEAESKHAREAEAAESKSRLVREVKDTSGDTKGAIFAVSPEEAAKIKAMKPEQRRKYVFDKLAEQEQKRTTANSELVSQLHEGAKPAVFDAIVRDIKMSPEHTLALYKELLEEKDGSRMKHSVQIRHSLQGRIHVLENFIANGDEALTEFEVKRLWALVTTNRMKDEFNRSDRMKRQYKHGFDDEVERLRGLVMETMEASE